MKHSSRHTNGADEGQIRRLHWLYAVVILVSLLLFVTCSFLQFANNRKNAQNSCSLMMDQLKELITENEKNLQQLTDTLKEEYTIRADMAADHFEHDWTTYKTAEDFQKLVELLQVDEIHVFDKNGRLINGSVPEYYGFTLSSGKQMAYFKPMLTNHDLSLCQDVTPNTAEGKPMMYAMVWTKNEEYLVQVGVTPERLFDWMRSSDISKIVSRLPLIDGMSVYIVDDSENTVIAASDSEKLGYKLLQSDRITNSLDEGVRHQGTATFNGHKRYIAYERCGDYDILVSYIISVANKTLPASMLEFALILIATFLILLLVTRRYTGYMEKQGQQLMMSNMAKTDFLRRMSHDIRTPLNGIIGLLEIDAAHSDDVELIASNRGKMQVAANHLLSLINDVLQMSKLESGEIVLAHELLDLNQLSDEVLTIVNQKAAEACINIVLSPDSDTVLYPWVYGSPLHLRQIFLNIFTNCIKYNKVGGSVTTRFQCVKKTETTVTYRWTITDTGIGMNEKFVKHIFDPFTQENIDARSVYQGTGLGMTIVKELLERMKGSIEVKSTEGVGSTFVLTIPFEIAKSAPVHSAEKIDSGEVGISGLSLILAEDNDLNAEIAQTLLEDAGATIVRAQDGLQAVNLFEENPAGTFDAILMDLMMPVMDGLTATKTIRKLDRADAKSIPIIAMTANAFAEDAEKCIAAGMNAHLPKPLDVDRVIATIAQYTHLDSMKNQELKQ